ncbi:unnamed protein product [Mytilus edulis]|uniref:Uncharacterized protein n=1 Tax=Mytilus edulis TaxID=6550 RepID=A0A8S3T2J5_MYTED|nr:unnamed protein product [Mytilus edulis]
MLLCKVLETPEATQEHKQWKHTPHKVLKPLREQLPRTQTVETYFSVLEPPGAATKENTNSETYSSVSIETPEEQLREHKQLGNILLCKVLKPLKTREHKQWGNILLSKVLKPMREQLLRAQTVGNISPLWRVETPEEQLHENTNSGNILLCKVLKPMRSSYTRTQTVETYIRYWKPLRSSYREHKQWGNILLCSVDLRQLTTTQTVEKHTPLSVETPGQLQENTNSGNILLMRY